MMMMMHVASEGVVSIIRISCDKIIIKSFFCIKCCSVGTRCVHKPGGASAWVFALKDSGLVWTDPYTAKRAEGRFHGEPPTEI